MNEEFDYLFYLLEREEIEIDKANFLFQIQSHPNYPSLLSIIDTLDFFEIGNVALDANASEIENLPDKFIVLLDENSGKPTRESQFYFVERENGQYFFLKNKKKIRIEADVLKARWQSTVILVEKTEMTQPKSNDKSSIILFSSSITLFFAILLLNQNPGYLKLFAFLPLMGIVFSAFAISDSFGAQVGWVTKFCNLSTSTDCSSVIKSRKWKLFEFVDFSDLSIVFFVTQFISYFVLSLSKYSLDFFSIQLLLLLFAIPIVLISLFFQKFIEEKWCAICLSIIGIIVSELIYLFITQTSLFKFSLEPLLVVILIFLSTDLAWKKLKDILSSQKILKEFQIKANRFLHNYEIFKSSLLSRRRVELPFIPIKLGNDESKTKITIITNPFCNYCKSSHEMLMDIWNRHQKRIQINILIRVDLARENDQRKLFFRSLMSIYFNRGINVFIEALHYAFENKNISEWFSLYQQEKISCEYIDNVYLEQNKWCIDNEFNFTPCLFINGYSYPSQFEKDLLPFYINELLDDHFE